jgi:hypothetical protein
MLVTAVCVLLLCRVVWVVWKQLLVLLLVLLLVVMKQLGRPQRLLGDHLLLVLARIVLRNTFHLIVVLLLQLLAVLLPLLSCAQLGKSARRRHSLATCAASQLLAACSS